MSPRPGPTVLGRLLASTFTLEETFPRSLLVSTLCYPRACTEPFSLCSLNKTQKEIARNEKISNFAILYKSSVVLCARAGTCKHCAAWFSWL